MTTAEKMDSKVDRNPPYIPWKTLDNYIGSLKGAIVPHTLDGSIKPRGMAGGMWRQLQSALRFLGLTKDGNVVDDGFQSLVDAYDTDQWATAIKEFVLPAYDDIVGGLPLENATPAQLSKCFANASLVSGQMLNKCMRFYLHALKLSGIKYSSHLSMREPGTAPKRNGTAKRKPKPDQKSPPADTPANPEAVPTGMIDFPIPIGNTPSFIRIPRNITMEQFPMVAVMLNAVETLAKQNGAK